MENKPNGTKEEGIQPEIEIQCLIFKLKKCISGRLNTYDTIRHCNNRNVESWVICEENNVIDLIFTLIFCVRLLVFEVSLGYMVDHFKNVAHLSAKYRAEERTLPTHSLMEIIL